MSVSGDSPGAMEIYPVGRVHSKVKKPLLLAGLSDLTLTERMDRIRGFHQEVTAGVCEIEIFSPWEELLDGIEGFSHILVLYWPHLIDPQRRSLRKVHPMGRTDLPVQGVFATCSPARPNPVLVSAVPLLERRGRRLSVKGLEAVDESPVIDIKPFVQSYHGAENAAMPEWLTQLHRELGIP